MTRPCETIINLRGSEITPDGVNRLASHAHRLAEFVNLNHKKMTKAQIVELNAAVYDNWCRYWDSC